jgi:hypothetical protein
LEAKIRDPGGKQDEARFTVHHLQQCRKNIPTVVTMSHGRQKCKKRGPAIQSNNPWIMIMMRENPAREPWLAGLSTRERASAERTLEMPATRGQKTVDILDTTTTVGSVRRQTSVNPSSPGHSGNKKT